MEAEVVKEDHAMSTSGIGPEEPWQFSQAKGVTKVDI